MFCDVALPVPLDRVFTYALGGRSAAVGARVLVPFSGQRLVGVVLRLHDERPAADVEVKPVELVLDAEPLLTADLLELGRWIASYYVAPVGEVLRGMLPLTAEVRRHFQYRIADAGRRVLYAGAEKGSSRRSRLPAEEQAREYAALNYLENGDAARLPAMRAATGANKALLDGMVRKKWIVREPYAERRDARRLEQVVSLVGAGEKQIPCGDDSQKGSEEKQIPFGDDNQKGHEEKQIPCGDDNQKGSEEKQIPFGDDNQKGHDEKQIPCGDDSQKGSEEKQIPFGDDNQKGSGEKQIRSGDDSAKGNDEKQIPFGDDNQKGDEGRETQGSARRLPALNDNQLAVMAELAGAGGELPLRVLSERLRARGLPGSTLGTLVKRGLLCVRDVAAGFEVSGLQLAPGQTATHEHALNEAQTEALATIVAAMARTQSGADSASVAEGFAPHLLYGVTGSGKTAVYFAAIRRALDAGRGALLLVPEIGLTPSMAAGMVRAFGSEVALLHSQLTPDERAEQWHRIRRGEARVVVGTRSAVFAPVVHLGLILVDEEHDTSYKQEETPRYNARDCAVMRAKLLGLPVVLGSATPSLESWANAERGRYALITMTERVAARPLPAVELIDMREEFRAVAGSRPGAEPIFSRELLRETQATLDRGEQAIILLNRRGYSFVVMCRACGEKIECENCAIALTYHKGGEELQHGDEARAGERLQCHYCGFHRMVPPKCPKCASEHLFFLGAGSQQGEERLGELFPGARLGRMDRDTVRTRGDMERLLARLHSGEINLLVGTQMIAKGHDIHGVTLVGVVGADFALGLPDFRSAERVFQLLTQVSGRAGRGELPGRVLVQTYQPDHYVNKFAQRHDFTGFAAKEMFLRRAARYPPFSVLANLLVTSEHLEEALGWSGEIARWFREVKPAGVRLLGPAVAPIARIKRVYRYHMILKSERRDALTGTLRALLAAAEACGVPRRALTVDVDPMHLM